MNEDLHGRFSERTADLNVAVSEQRCEIEFDGAEIYFDVEGCALSDSAETATAALWAVLPVAMQRRVNIRLTRPVDPLALSNARKLVAVWNSWVPENYHFVEILSDHVSLASTPCATGRLFFFSGGLDSHSMLLRHSDFTPDDKTLTIRGLDYPVQGEGFDALRQKTQPILDHFGLARIVVTTNIARVVRKLKLNHGFALASVGFLFSHAFKSCHLSADAKVQDEFLIFPWGTNSVTNRLFSATDYAMVTECLDEGRTEKVVRLSKYPEFLPGLSLCSDAGYRPENCGRCGKCVRTKARFYVMTGQVPPIFQEDAFDGGYIERLNFKDKVIFQSMTELFHASGPDLSNPTVRLIRDKLDRAVRSKRPFWKRLASS
jgi:hypothetical protein